MVKQSIAAGVVLGLLVMTVQAQKVVTQSEAVSETFVIDAIDPSSRSVTLRNSEGLTRDIVCGSDVERFDALKVGDTVTFRYHEARVFAIRKPGEPVSRAQGGGAVIERAAGERPGGTLSQQSKATVTVNAIDTKVPSVTVTTADGRKKSFKVEDAKNLQTLKVGDRVEITYTKATAVSVAPAGK